jgi:hypothetical protein
MDDVVVEVVLEVVVVKDTFTSLTPRMATGRSTMLQ